MKTIQPYETLNEERLSQKNFLDKEKVRETRAKKILFDLISSVLVLFVGYAVYKATGLHESVTSTEGRIALGTVISTSYLIVFRRAYYSR